MSLILKKNYYIALNRLVNRAIYHLLLFIIILKLSMCASSEAFYEKDFKQREIFHMMCKELLLRLLQKMIDT